MKNFVFILISFLTIQACKAQSSSIYNTTDNKYDEFVTRLSSNAALAELSRNDLERASSLIALMLHASASGYSNDSLDALIAKFNTLFGTSYTRPIYSYDASLNTDTLYLDSISFDSGTTWMDSTNLADFLRTVDSITQHRTEIDANLDSITQHRTDINTKITKAGAIDTVETHTFTSLRADNFYVNSNSYISDDNYDFEFKSDEVGTLRVDLQAGGYQFFTQAETTGIKAESQLLTVTANAIEYKFHQTYAEFPSGSDFYLKDLADADTNWLYIGGDGKVGSDSLADAGFALDMELESLEQHLNDRKDGEIKWYTEKNGKITYTYGLANRPRDVIQQLQAQQEITLRYLMREKKKNNALFIVVGGLICILLVLKFKK